MQKNLQTGVPVCILYFMAQTFLFLNVGIYHVIWHFLCSDTPFHRVTNFVCILSHPSPLSGLPIHPSPPPPPQSSQEEIDRLKSAGVLLRTKAGFVATLAHEVRTPLNAMLQSITLLPRGRPAPQRWPAPQPRMGGRPMWLGVGVQPPPPSTKHL